jgi:hypothetical protein
LDAQPARRSTENIKIKVAILTVPEEFPNALYPMLARHHLRHHGNQDWSPSRQHDIANSVWNGVAQSREITIRLFLDRAKRSGDRPCAATSTQDDYGVHPQYVTTE